MSLVIWMAWWLVPALLIFAAILRRGQAARGMVLAAGAALLWPVWGVLVVIGMAIDVLGFLLEVIRRPH